MKPSERFRKKVWRKPPKGDAKGMRVSKKTGIGRCAVCKEIITSLKRQKVRRAFTTPKNQLRTNRPFGGYLCTKCLKAAIIQKTREIES